MFGASLITFSGFAANELMHLTVLTSFYLFLAQLFVLEKLLEISPSAPWSKRFVWTMIMGLLLGLSVLGGHPQITFYSLLFLGPYWLFWWVVKRKGSYGKLGLYGFLYAIVGLGIGAGQFLPMLEFTRQSTRASGLSTAALERFNFPISDLVTFVLPFAKFDPNHTLEAFVNNGWPTDERYVYMGIVGLGFALAGMLFIRRLGSRAVFFVAVALLAMLFAFGSQFTTGYIFA